MQEENLIAITFDIDWAPDEVIRYTVDLLDKYGVKATFFATHDSNYLKALSAKYEIGIHPNFRQCNDYDKVMRELKAIYPEAIGVRSHSLYQSSEIHQLFIEYGLKYEVNTFIPLRKGLYPFVRLKKLVCIPFYWEDDLHFINQVPFEFSQLHVRQRGLKIFSLHPIHVFMNTSSMEHYQSYKPFYQQPDVLKEHRNPGKGVQTLFIELLEYLVRNRLPTLTCEEIYQDYVARGKPL